LWENIPFSKFLSQNSKFSSQNKIIGSRLLSKYGDFKNVFLEI